MGVFTRIAAGKSMMLADTPEARLKALAQNIPNLEAFDILARTATRPEAFRRLVRPLLKQGIRCCATSWRGSHTAGCPAQKVDHAT